MCAANVLIIFCLHCWSWAMPEVFLLFLDECQRSWLHLHLGLRLKEWRMAQ